MKLKNIKIFILFCLVIMAVGPVFGDEAVTMWSNIYDNNENLSQKRQIMLQIVQQNNQDFGPFLIEAQTDLVAITGNGLSVQDRHEWLELQKTAIDAIGNLGLKEAEKIVFETFKSSKDAHLKAKAVITLGKIGATDYADAIIAHLNDLNYQTYKYNSAQETETMVNACVLALVFMGIEKGYTPVFFVVANNDFSKRTVDFARQKLDEIVEDPSGALQEIILSSSEYEHKLLALQVGKKNEKIPTQGCLEIAKTGLSEGVKYNASDRSQQTTLSRLRSEAAGVFADQQYDDDDVVEILEQMLIEMQRQPKYDINELIVCVKALGNTKSSAATDVLIDNLTRLNENPSLRGQRDMRNAIATIESLVNNGSTRGRSVITAVAFSGWSGRVERAARQALGQLN